MRPPTLEGPTPTNISRNSDPDTLMKGTAASPAVALASSVLPVPGGPVTHNRGGGDCQYVLKRTTVSG